MSAARLPRRPLLASSLALAACSALPRSEAPPIDPLERARALLARMSLEDKAGQVMSVAFHGTSVPDSLEQVIHEQRVSSIIIFKENIASPERLASLLNDLQRIAKKAKLQPPLFPVDQEGGALVRLGKGATVLPGEMALAATPDPPSAIARAAAVTAQECRALGLNFVLAPVADVNNNPRNPIILNRAFGSDPARVAEATAAMVRAYRAAGLLCCAKHFPGHGDTGVDSHSSLPELEWDLARLERVELVPFRAAIAAEVPAILTGHLRLPALDPTPNVSATLSRTIVTELLRGRLGFRGLVVTDDLEMGAIAKSFRTSGAGALALAAGADLLFFRFDVGEQRAGHRLIVERVRGGEIPQSRLDEAALGVLAAKARWGVLDQQPVQSGAAARLVATEANRATALDLARESITVLRNRGVLPMRGKKVLAISPNPDDLRFDEALVDDQLPFGAHLSKLLPVTERGLRLRPSASDIAAHLEAARTHDVVVVATFEVAKYPQQATLVNQLAAAKPVVVVSLRSPYDILAFPGIAAYLCAYHTRDVGGQAAAEVLAGARAPVGKLPVEVPGIFALGAGMTSL